MGELDLLIVYEDSHWRELWPLDAVRPSGAIRVGADPVLAKARRWTGAARAALDAFDAARGPALAALAAECGLSTLAAEPPARAGVLWWNGAALPGQTPLPAIPRGARGVRLVADGGRPVGLLHEARAVEPATARQLLERAASLPEGWAEERSDAVFCEAPWSVIAAHERELTRDLASRLDAFDRLSTTRAHVLGEVRAHADAEVEPGVVLDGRPGPIVIEAGARLEALTHVVGPSWIGPETHLLGGRLATVSLGPLCRVGGEVESTTFQGYANKRHEGFLGHAWVGEWVNFGALTTNSDLKNNYGTVRVWKEGREVDSRETKVGCFLADHGKTGIGTLLATGAVIGPASNLVGGGRFTPRYLPGWSWWDGERVVPHEWARFLATARTAMGRRGRSLDERIEAALRAAWESGPRAEGEALARAESPGREAP